MVKPVIKTNDVGDAYDIVMDAIVTQKLRPSQKVSENILSDMFGISRTISRNLIERLLAQQFLVSLSPRVTQVAPLTLLEIKQNFTLRKVLLPEIISLSGAKVDFEQIDKLNEQIQDTLPFDDDNAALELLKINKQLNLALCTPAGYPLVDDWARQLEDTAMRIYWLYIKTKKSFPYSSKQQSLILDVIKSDEPKKIHAVIQDMIIQTEERILNAIFSHEQFYTQDLVV
ncbi:GntR family transcriptional regulator [Neptunicella marina]|uniref:GntR family transcriptional regulator n=1 Tax=Neptunicella marina TaxID=2125989 RepID=A0A8J6ITH1_9ALTE|nr:GntR family transcriptional regulator [Neptunicella marina]MBC3765617.1 GntR family transcriptional regulator [Neptunicella marina]